jgi:hypothetical protein
MVHACIPATLEAEIGRIMDPPWVLQPRENDSEISSHVVTARACYPRSAEVIGRRWHSKASPRQKARFYLKNYLKQKVQRCASSGRTLTY